MAGTYIAYFSFRFMASRPTMPPIVIVAMSMLLAGLGAGILAVLLELIAYRPLRHESPVAVLLSAIGVAILLENVGIHLFGAHTRGFPELSLNIAPRWIAVITLALSAMSLYAVIFRTHLGIQMRAVAEKPEIAALMGITPNRTIMYVFFIGGFFAGIAGVIWGLVYGTVHPQMGFYPGLKAFIIAVVGSIGNLAGTFFIGISLGLLEALVSGYMPSMISEFRDVLVFLALLAVLLFFPTGVFAKSGMEKV